MEENKELDDFIKKSIQEVGLENPSEDFTNAIFSKIENQNSTTFVTKPLLSKYVWFGILTFVAAIFGFVIFGNMSMESTWGNAIQLNKLTSVNLSLKMPNLPFSNVFVYGLVAVAVFIWIQVLVLKKQLDKRYRLHQA